MSTLEPSTSRYSRSCYRQTARVIGVIYLAGMVVGIGGNLLIQSVIAGPDPLAAVAANRLLLGVGVVLWLTAVVGDAAHGVLMFPLLSRHSLRMALGYLSARIVDAVFIAVMALLILVQIPLGAAFVARGAGDAASLQTLSGVAHQAELYAYELGMVTVGIAGLVLCTVFRRTGLVPRALAVWGLVGYAILLVGSLLQILGLDLRSVQALPGGLWEGFTGVWLIAKGFSPSATAFAGPTPGPTVPLDTSLLEPPHHDRPLHDRPLHDTLLHDTPPLERHLS